MKQTAQMINSSHEYLLDKSPWMICFFFLLWFLSLGLFGPRLWLIIIASKSAFEFTLLFIFFSMLMLFWLLAAYYITVVLFSLHTKPLPRPTETPEATWPAVAVLYPTCNDFKTRAVMACLNQQYPRFHVFLLDDSTNEEQRARVDAFHAAHLERTTIVRRPTRQGYKAGNLNNALQGAASAFPFFAVVDADEVLPDDFLRRTMAYLKDSDLAFVQANHAPNPEQESTFAHDIAPTILPFWDIHCRPRNRYGFVLFLGHGAVVRRSAWERAGGFPEVITEDLAFSALLAKNGLRGIFLESVVCNEDFPATYPAFKRQHERYVIGTTQVMLQYLLPLLRSRSISLIEKIDFCLWCLPLYVPALCLVFAVVSSLGLTGLLGGWGALAVTVFGHPWVLPVIRIFDQRFAPLWLMDFQLFSILCAFTPTFACLALGFKGKLHSLKLLFLSTVPYMSLMVVSWRGILGYLFTGRTLWPPTGEAPAKGMKKGASIPRSQKIYSWRSPRVAEIILGLLLAVASLISFNVALFAVCLCLLIGVWVEISGWENRWVKAVSTGVFTLIVLQIFINIAFLFQPSMLVPLVFSVHF